MPFGDPAADLVRGQVTLPAAMSRHCRLKFEPESAYISHRGDRSAETAPPGREIGGRATRPASSSRVTSLGRLRAPTHAFGYVASYPPRRSGQPGNGKACLVGNVKTFAPSL
jgi:hypothetical protein